MSTLAEIKTAVDALPDEERIELDAHIWAKLRKTPVTYSDILDERMRDMDAGKKCAGRIFAMMFCYARNWRIDVGACFPRAVVFFLTKRCPLT